jgi:hypothetical protein
MDFYVLGPVGTCGTSFQHFWGKVSNEKNTESRSHPVSGMWRKYASSWENFFGILRVTAKYFVKSENIFPPRTKK